MYLRFLCTIFLWPYDLDLWPFNLGGVSCIRLHTSNAWHTNFSILRSSVPELWVTQSDHITITWSGHCPCAVSRGLSPGGKNDPNFEILDPNFHCHFQGDTTTIKPCYRRKLAVIPLWRLQNSLRMRRITSPLHRGSPKTTRNIYWPRIVHLLCNFYGATMTIKGCLYWSIPVLKRFSTAKNLSPVKMTVLEEQKPPNRSLQNFACQVQSMT